MFYFDPNPLFIVELKAYTFSFCASYIFVCLVLVAWQQSWDLLSHVYGLLFLSGYISCWMTTVINQIIIIIIVVF